MLKLARSHRVGPDKCTSPTRIVCSVFCCYFFCGSEIEPEGSWPAVELWYQANATATHLWMNMNAIFLA